ncbi:MAG TPA: hypothetical protein VF809_00850 [Candidatus Saccharimonadales bacterium]
MIVKFLSFAATIIGTARYKTILLSCIALVISLTGITAIAITKSGNIKKDASATVKQSDNPDKQDPSLGASSFRSLGTKEAPTEESQQPATGTSTAPPQPKATDTTKQTNTTEAPAVDIVLSDNTVTISNSSPATITANTSDNSTVVWTVSPETHDGVHLTTQESTTGFSFQITADDNATAGNHIFTITAKDASRKIDIIKQITVIIP